MYMDNLYNKIKLCRAAYVENKLLHGVAITHRQDVPKQNYSAVSKEQEKTGKSDRIIRSRGDEG